ncbi:hypothetical protein KY345_04895, partial [Candidatus Woesearchaeota archaeon]|nr:hypothetical protein [Candidatus Woesearchaeota archaeon]
MANWKIVFLLLVIVLVGCSAEERFQSQLDKAMAKEFNYSSYNNNGFSITYPDWPETKDKDEKTEVSVSVGYCTVVVNTEEMTAKQWYDAMIKAIESKSII